MSEEGHDGIRDVTNVHVAASAAVNKPKGILKTKSHQSLADDPSTKSAKFDEQNVLET